MGSGLILLVIVGAWLAVLVPMGLRSHDGSAPTAHERLDSAVRVLRRRTGAAPLDEQYDASSAELDDDLDADDAPAPRWAERLEGVRGWRPPGGLLHAPGALLHTAAASLRGARAALADRRADRLPLTPAARRRRVLLTLVLVTVLAALAGRVGPAWLLDVAGLSAVAALLWLVSCRRCAARRELAPVRPSYVPVVAPVPAVADTTELFDLEASEPAAVEAVAEPARVPRQARPAAGAEWQPVPVPLPMYVGSGRAPVRVVEPAAWSPAQEDDDEQGVFEPRRVVSGW